MRHLISTRDSDPSPVPDPRWSANGLEARGLGGFSRRLTVQAAAIKQSRFARGAADQCGILIYRRLAPCFPGAAKPANSVTPERFREQLAGLLERGRVFWPLEKVLDFEHRQWRVMPWVTTLLFDIGFAGVHAYALPVLCELRIPATVFLENEHFSYDGLFPADDWARQNHDRLPANAFRPLNAEECGELAGSGLVCLGSLSPAGTHAPDGRLSLDDRLARGMDQLAWNRVHVTSWDSSRTLVTRLNGRAGSPAKRPGLIFGWLSPTPRSDRRLVAPSTAATARHLEKPEAPATISVIVPTYNRAQWIGEALQSLIDQETDGRFTYDIHVVDNASSDATSAAIARVAATSPITIHTHRQELPGDAPTRNLGVADSAGKWLAFFDDDQLAASSWLRELWSATAGGQRPIVGGAVHLQINDQELTALDPLCRAALRETRLYPTARPYRRRDLPGTGNALVARAVFDAVGNFDETMTGGGSDCDFFTRARDAGFPLWYTPTAVVRHRVSAERLTPEFLRWDALSGGAEHAGYFDFQRRGLTALLGLCGARLVQALLIHVPLLLWARLRGDAQAALGRRISLWRTEGYVRRTLAIIAPAWFAQPHFFESLDLRQGRSICERVA